MFRLSALAGSLLLAGIAAGEIPADSPARGALAGAQRAVDTIVAMPDGTRTFANTVAAIDDLYAQLEIQTNIPRFLAYVHPDSAVRANGQRVEEDVNAWLIDLSQHEGLYRAVASFAATNPTLEPEDQRLLDHTLRDFRRAGMALEQEQRDELAAKRKELAKLEVEFQTNIRESAEIVPLLAHELEGMPEDYLASLRQSDGMYLVGLSYPEFLPIMDLCPIEDTRRKMWIAYKRRGGESNIAVLERILALRHEIAGLLGYDTPADYEIEVKMAGDAASVMEFYERLRPLVRKKALLDWAELQQAKREDVGDPEAVLAPWDSSYYMNVLRREKYAVDSEKVREYFPMDRVTEGLFTITQSLYGITYREITDLAVSRGIELWHEDVRVYEVWDDQTGEMLGMFSTDLHPRPNKYGHAAQWGLAQHKIWSNGNKSLPVAALVCNFTKPTADKPSLLSHDEVETYFHEFGHCLHTILSTAEHWRFAGTGVERDFVEAPSQMFENWVWDADVLAMFAKHYETDETFPRELLDGMIAAKNLGSGMLAERQFFYGLFDMMCHLDDDGVVDTTGLAHELWGEVGDGVELYGAVPETFFHASFGHLTGYQAGYYGYQWSLVYACDMFDRFRELGMLDPEAGRYYRDTILARGGTSDGLDLVREYLGREPEMGAFLKHLGLEE